MGLRKARQTRTCTANICMCMVVAVRVVVDGWFAAYQGLVQYCDTVGYSMNMRQHKCILALVCTL